MAKGTAKKDTTAAKKSKGNSEIDDIFATKKLPPKDDVEQDSVKPSKKNKKKTATKDGKDKDQHDEPEKEEEEEENKDDAKVEEVVFAELAAVKKGTKRQERPAPPQDDDNFGDSRGKKAKRTTDDGYPLYDVKDLRIGEGQGDTPLCPFDCDCCF